MVSVVISGGGWSGCAAALSAAKASADVTICERTDMLLGTGLVGGIMRNNGRYTATEEMIAMGGGELFKICDNNMRHKNINFPGHNHACLYDIARTHGAVTAFLKEQGIKINFRSRIVEADVEEGSIKWVKDQNGNKYYGDVFIDATGTAGPPKNCAKYGNGCAMCIIRCPSFGGRVSLSSLAGINEYIGKKSDDSYGSMSGSCKLLKESLSKEIQDELNSKGVVIIPLPEEKRADHLGIKACQQYALEDYKNNLILLDTGHAKLMTPYYPLEDLRSIPGFENARYEDPYAGGIGNSVRFLAMVRCDESMKVEGAENLFCCGEKSGPFVGHTEAIVTGTIAGHNSVRHALGMELVKVPESLAVGDAISYVRQQVKTEDGITKKYTFSGSVYFKRMKELGLYTTDMEEIRKRVENAGMTNAFSRMPAYRKLSV